MAGSWVRRGGPGQHSARTSWPASGRCPIRGLRAPYLQAQSAPFADDKTGRSAPHYQRPFRLFPRSSARWTNRLSRMPPSAAELGPVRLRALASAAKLEALVLASEWGTPLTPILDVLAEAFQGPL